MLPETEQLFQKWLKGQILKQRMSLITSLLITGMIIFSLWFSVTKLLPLLQKQMENTGSLLQFLTPGNQNQKVQEDLFKNLPGQLR